MFRSRRKIYPDYKRRNTNESAKYETGVGTAAGWMFATCNVGFLFTLVGFITNSWHNSGNTFSGLWMACQFESTTISQFHMDLIKAAFILAMVAYVFAIVFLLMFFFTEPECITPKSLLIFYLVFMVFFVLLTIIGAAIFGSLTKVNMSWSFGFEIIAIFFAFICVVLTGIMLSQGELE